MYLNKKHEALVPKLAAALKSMKDDGTYQKLFNMVHLVFERAVL